MLEAVEATDGWATNVRAGKPPMTMMGELGGVEAGLTQLRRATPLETQKVELPVSRTSFLGFAAHEVPLDVARFRRECVRR